MTMTCLIGTTCPSRFSSFTLLLHLPLLLLLVVTLPLLLVDGLQVTSPHANVTPWLTPDSSILLSKDSPSHSSLMTSSKTNITVPAEVEDEHAVIPKRGKQDKQKTNLFHDFSARSTLTSDDSRAASPVTSGSRDDEDLRIVDQKREGDEILPNCTYRTSRRILTKDKDVSERLNGSFSQSTGHKENDELYSVKSPHSRLKRQTISLHGPLWADKTTLFVELMAIGDYSFCQHHGANALDRINQVVGIANMLFAPLGIVIVLADVRLWRSGNLAEIYHKKTNTLNSMHNYRQRLLEENPNQVYDNLMLITRELEYGAGGVASTGAMCNGKFSVNIVQDLDKAAGIVGSILAHEMGHNFGMAHDGEGENFSGVGNCRDAHSIMEASLSVEEFNPNMFWSECSSQYVAKMLKTMDLDCLRNVPTRTYSSSCGNGIVEYGEECDCGPPELCKNKCCDSKTCRLAPQASCASGACCNIETCKPHPAGKVCRDALNECDLPEYCSGKDEQCPQDVYKGDGAHCSYGQGHCFKGICGSHHSRCRRLFGSQASVAADKCYHELIHRGDRAGNCGQSGDQYTYCDEESIRCGTLYCDARGNDKVELSARKTHFVTMEYAGSSLCYFVEGYISHYPAEDWLSPNGASCGDRKMCLNQKCTKIPGKDDTLNCPNKCSGRGVCNNRGNCHCNPGYAPPDCAKPGPGGSYDSGLAPAPRGGMVALWFFLAILLILVIMIIIICCFWIKIRMWWEIHGRDRISPVAPKVVSCIDNCLCSAVSKAVHYLVSTGPLGRVNLPFRKKDPESGRPRKKSGYRVDVEVKRHSQADHLDTDEHLNRKLKSSVNAVQADQYPCQPSETITRPKYQQSISVDSGCVIDDQDEQLETPSVNMSMSSLVNAFRSYTTKTQSEVCDKEGIKSNVQEHHKEVSLRRLVIDPKSGHRGGKKGLPQPYQKPPNSRHSISTDVSLGKRNSGTHKAVDHVDNVCKSHDDLSQAPTLAKNPFILANSRRKSSGQFSHEDKQLPSLHTHSWARGETEGPFKKPMMPPRKSRTPPRTTPPREPPPLPPVIEVVQEVVEVKVLQSKDKNPDKPKELANNKDTKNMKPKGISVSSGNVSNKLQSSLAVRQASDRQGLANPPRNARTDDGNSRYKATNKREYLGVTVTNKNTTNVNKVNGNKSVKSLTQKFENV